MAELEPFEVIMRIDFAGSNGLEIVAHAEKVAELVRCRDCTYYKKGSDGVSYCYKHDDDILWQDDDFCSRGERRTE